MAARPASSDLSRVTASTAWATEPRATASASGPSAAEIAASWPGSHVDEGGDGPEDAGQPLARGEQRGPAVLAGQAELEGLHAGGEGVAVALRLLLLEPQCLDPGLGLGQLGRGGLVLLVEPHLALVEAGHLGLERVEVGGGPVGAGPGVGVLGLEPLDLGRAGLEP